MYQIIKKDGVAQEYDANKLFSSILNAGASTEEAQQVVSQIEGWLGEQAENGVTETSSNDLRSEVSDALMDVNPDAAQTYSSYVKA